MVFIPFLIPALIANTLDGQIECYTPVPEEAEIIQAVIEYANSIDKINSNLITNSTISPHPTFFSRKNVGQAILNQIEIDGFQTVFANLKKIKCAKAKCGAYIFKYKLI